MGQQAEVLEDHREPPPAELAQPLLARLRGCPRRRARPRRSVGSISRVRHRTSVDLPLPDRPMTTKTSPGRTSNETSSTAIDPAVLRGRRRRSTRPTGSSPRLVARRVLGRAEDLPEVADGDRRPWRPASAAASGSGGRRGGRVGRCGRLGDRGHGMLLLGDARRARDGTPPRIASLATAGRCLRTAAPSPAGRIAAAVHRRRRRAASDTSALPVPTARRSHDPSARRIPAHELGPGARARRRHRRRHRRQQHGLPPRPPRLARHRPAREGHAAEPRRLDRPRLELHLPDRPLARR